MTTQVDFINAHLGEYYYYQDFVIYDVAKNLYCHFDDIETSDPVSSISGVELFAKRQETARKVKKNELIPFYY